MTTVNRSFVIAVFKNENQAQQAIHDLMSNGFNRDQIRYSVRKGGGGIADDLVNMGLPRQEADYYNHEFEQGNTVVTVHTPNQQQQAFNILKKDGGYDFNTNQGRETNYAAPAGAPVPPAGREPRGPIANATTANAGNVAINNTNAPNTANAPGTPTGEREIELRAEEIQPTTRWEQIGEVELGKKVVSQQQTIDVPVSREEVVIERHPVSGGQVSNTPINANENETIRVPVSGEKVDVEKETVVAEEVTVGKRREQETEHFTDTVRREELEVNEQGNVDIENANPQNPQNQRNNPNKS